MQPLFTLRDRGLSVSAFQSNDNVSFAVQKSWKKKDSNEYERREINLFEDDLLKLARLFVSAYAESVKYRAKGAPAPSAAPEPVINDEIPF